MKKRKMIGKLLLVPDFNGKTIEVPFYSYSKWIAALVGSVLIAIVVISANRYSFYQHQMHSLMNDQHVTNNSINEISMDAIQTKRELMRLKYEIGCLDKFIVAANTFDKDATTKLAIPYSHMTFTDYFLANSNKYDQAHPASSAEITSDSEAQKEKNLKESLVRQANYKALMDITPSGYPTKGMLVSPGHMISGPGIAIKCPVGTPIHATASGKICRMIDLSEKEADVSKKCFLIEIAHKEEKSKVVKSLYYYCYQPAVIIGQPVKKGQLIAFSGVCPTNGDNVACYQVNINHLLIQPK